jgi:hypothetical protein
MSFLDTSKISADISMLYNILDNKADECSKSMEKYNKYFMNDNVTGYESYCGSNTFIPTVNNLSIINTSNSGSSRSMSRTISMSSSAHKRCDVKVHPLCPF